MKHLSAAKIAFLVLIVFPLICINLLVLVQGVDLNRQITSDVNGWGAVFIIGSLLFVSWLIIWWGTRPNYEPYIRRYEALARQQAAVDAEIERTELLLDIARASDSPAYDDFRDRLDELLDTAEALLKEQEIVAKELPKGYLEQKWYREHISPAEIQTEQNALLAASAMMALGGMMSSDQSPFHHHG